jgi:hypothetical protein
MADNDVATTATPHVADEELSVQQAADRFELSAASLAQRLRLGEIGARKVRGPHGGEWRVTASALEALGYRRRSSPLSAALDREQLLRNLERLRKALETELHRCASQQAGLERIQTELRALEEALAEAGSRKSGRRTIKQVVPHQRSKT